MSSPVVVLRVSLPAKLVLPYREGNAAHDYWSPRDAILHGTALATAYIGREELEQACEVGRTALDRLPHVNSPRGLASLGRLADKLRSRKG